MGRRRLYCATLRARRTKRLDQRHEIARDRDETPRSFGPRPRRGLRCWALCPRRDQDVVSSRDCLETETSRPRPHPCMQTIYTLLQTDNHNTTSLNFYRPDALPDAQPTLSKHWRPYYICNNKPHLAFIQWCGQMIIRNASPGCIQTNGIVYCPINSSPMKSSSSTANRISANSGRFMWNSKLSSNIGLAANIQVQSAKKIPVYFKALQHF